MKSVMSKPILMSAGGRITLPAEARRKLGVLGEAQFQLEVDDTSITLTPALMVPREDSWAYTPEYRALVARSREEAARGLAKPLTKSQLKKLGG